MNLRFTPLVLALLFAFFVSAAAQDTISTEKLAAINELMALIKVDDKAEDIVRIMTVQLQTTRAETVKTILDKRTDLTKAEKASLEDEFLKDEKESIRRFQDKLIERLNFSKTVNEISASVYDKYYTLEELKDLIAFYKTPTGQKSLRLMTPIFAETMRQMQERLLPKVPIIMQQLQDEDRKEREQKINARKPKPDRMSS
jgi:uncharacterized protein